MSGCVSCHAGDRIRFANALAFATQHRPRKIAGMPTFVTGAPVVAGGGVAGRMDGATVRR